MPRTFRLLLPACVLGLAACTAVDPRPAGLTRWEAAQLQRIEAGLAGSPQRVHDAGLERYLRVLLSRLDATAADLRVYVLDLPAPQVDLLADQVLRIRSGMLAEVRNEDELAFVLAHELAHRALGHLAARREREWDATAGERAADAAACNRLQRTGYRCAAARALLVRLRRRFEDEAARAALTGRIEALPVGDTDSRRIRSTEFEARLARFRRDRAER